MISPGQLWIIEVFYFAFPVNLMHAELMAKLLVRAYWHFCRMGLFKSRFSITSQ